jgi:hypothetical protein
MDGDENIETVKKSKKVQMTLDGKSQVKARKCDKTDVVAVAWKMLTMIHHLLVNGEKIC